LSITKAFHIPADFDDTFVNIGLGSLLKRYATSGQPYNMWSDSNTGMSAAIEALKKYSYKPSSQSIDSNCIDTRTYFYLRDFFDAYSSDNLALVTTWVQNITEVRRMYYMNYSMPFNVNNVDLTVSANVIYGITSAVLSDMHNPSSWFDGEVQQLCENTSSLIAYETAHNFTSRPDIALTYYPSVYSFYWFTSRTANLLNSFDKLPYPVLERMRVKLNTALRGPVTSNLMDRAKIDKNDAYFDDFLGDNDKDIFGIPVNHGDDRIFSTSMAINSLLYTWSQGDKLVSDVPTNVRELLVKACNWLMHNANSDRYQHSNAFFSGSVKSSQVSEIDKFYRSDCVFKDVPFDYPSNYLQWLNGTAIPSNYTFGYKDTDTIGCVSGTVPLTQYNQWLKHKQHGDTVPLDFYGFNSGYGFPYWSSDAFTYASSLLSLVQCKAYNLLK
jgi:hypothetical protein